MKREKNVAIILPSLFGGGAERTAQTIGDYYFDLGYKVFYFLFENTRKKAYEVKGEIVHMGLPLSYSGFDSVLLAASTVRKFKRKYEIEVAISFMEEANFLNILSKGKERVIASVHTTLSSRDELRGIFYNPRLIKLVYNFSDYVVAVSNYVGMDLIKNYGIRQNKIIVIPNPALKREDASETAEWKWGSKAILSVGRLDAVKQQDHIIRAFSCVKKQCDDAQLVFVGEGKLRKYLERVSKEYKVESSVHFVGFSDSLGFFYRNAKAFVMASKAEGFPNAMVEAMAYGVPVVTTDSPGGCGEIVGKEESCDDIQMCQYGILVPYLRGRIVLGDSPSKEDEQLGRALLLAINDENVYEDLSEKSKYRAEHYSLDKIMNRWAKLLQ